MSFEENDLTGDLSGLGPFELDALQEWEYKFMGKYVKVGTIKKHVPVAEESSPSELAQDIPKPAVDGLSPKGIPSTHKAEEAPSVVGAEDWCLSDFIMLGVLLDV